MSLAAVDQQKLEINRVVGRTVEVLQRNWRSLVRPALLYLYLPGVLVGALDPQRGPFGYTSGAHAAAPLISLLALIPYTIIFGGLIRLAVADLRAEAISTDEAMAVGRARLWPLLGLSLLTGLGIGLGMLLLIVPGVMLATAWAVNGAVLIEERRPVMETFRRSAELTRGSRLNIFGVGLLFLVLHLVGAMAAALVSAPFPRLIGSALVWPIPTAVIGVVGAVVVAVIYEELRNLKAEPPVEVASPQA